MPLPLQIKLRLRMCDRCLANAGLGCDPAMDYRNFGDSKAWDLTYIPHEGYLSWDANSLTPWLSMEGFKVETMAFDWMHNVFLGTGRDLVASGIKTLVKHDCYQNTGLTTVDDILSHVDLQIRTTCKQHGFLQPRNQYLDEAFSLFPQSQK